MRDGSDRDRKRITDRWKDLFWGSLRPRQGVCSPFCDDASGAGLARGDTVTLIKDNPEHIEARVKGQWIVILTQFVKKAN